MPFECAVFENIFVFTLVSFLSYYSLRLSEAKVLLLDCEVLVSDN